MRLDAAQLEAYDAISTAAFIKNPFLPAAPGLQASFP
jgi:hypothetical protein